MRREYMEVTGRGLNPLCHSLNYALAGADHKVVARPKYARHIAYTVYEGLMRPMLYLDARGDVIMEWMALPDQHVVVGEVITYDQSVAMFRGCKSGQ